MVFSEECDLAEGKGSARRAAEQTGQKTGYIYRGRSVGSRQGGAATREALTYCQGGTREGNARGGGKGLQGLQGRETSTETKS